MNFQQLRIGADNFSYIIYSKNNKTAIIDPGFQTSKIIDFINSEDLIVEYIIITHHHSDHTYGVKKLKTNYPKAKIIASEIDGEKIDSKVDCFVENGDIIKIDEINMKIIHTPGHTPGGICIIVNNKFLLTGDTLFIGDCGRTDLQGGDIHNMYLTLKDIIMNLPDDLIVYPGHDYGEKPFDTLGNQKKTNKTLKAKSFDDFSKIY